MQALAYVKDNEPVRKSWVGFHLRRPGGQFVAMENWMVGNGLVQFNGDKMWLLTRKGRVYLAKLQEAEAILEQI